ncbi:hypothetical protein CHS0354_032287 [Potamilus streckersoni]|uniref:Methyltransferase FkbM domain-containing protein n=1 Tax=Potamilus streckersoni TaxID=2493646 RepID=A0AAE0VGJ0_9BIVA|nr:hypothetical protein CHS0354_032287 [Potamilus streckersoni]
MIHLLRNKFFIAATLSLTLLIGSIQLVFYFNQISPQDIYVNEFSIKIKPVKELISSTENLAADDPRLISLIRQEFLVPPHPGPYNLKDPDVLDPSCGQSTAVDKLLEKKEKGFYVEAGAFDGESISNTLFFERVRKWNGLLVEPDPKTYFRLQSKHRNAYLINACLSVGPKPSIVTFNAANEMGHVIQNDEDRRWVEENLNKWDLIEVPCFPLLSILLALEQMEVDYFSLDIEGYELAVLKSIPFDKVKIRFLTVEFMQGQEGYASQIKSFLEMNGLVHVFNMKSSNETCPAEDAVFRLKE